MSTTNIKQISGNIEFQPAHGFSVGSPVYQAAGVYALAQSDVSGTAGEYFVSEVVDANTFVLALPQQDVSVTMSTLMETGHPALSFPADNGKPLFVSETEAGKYTTTAPTIRNILGTLQDTDAMRSLGTAEALLAAPAGGGGSGATAFTGLTDTPGTLGTAGQIIQVNAGGTALEFVDNDSPFVVSSVSANTTHTNQDVFLVDGSGGTVNITIDPTALGKRLEVKAIDTTNTVTITPLTGTIDGNATYDFTVDNYSVGVVSDGTNLFLI